MVMSMIMTCLFAVNVHAQDVDYRAQSLYIYKFSKFIYWPENTMSGEFKIGVYGNSPILEELELMASIKKGADGLDITIAEVSDDDDLTGFNLIYIPSSKSRQIRDLASRIGDKPVLLVAEREGLASKGATISFLVTDNMVLKFEVNMSKLRSQDLEISDELLSLGYEI